MKRLQGTVTLPGSKSESNRVLMMAAYGGFPADVENLSDAHDTVLLTNLLNQTSLRAQRSNPHVVEDATSTVRVDCFVPPRCARDPRNLEGLTGPWGGNDVVVDCEDAGTVSRFLMTYLAGKPGNWLLTGNPRLCERPMVPLIDALRQLGADITTLSNLNGLPLRIHGKRLEGGSVTLDASLSSQFASSLLMAAPTWERGLQLVLTGTPVSMPYLEMTMKMMEYFGVQVIREGNTITVPHQAYQSRPFKVDADWSAASYWYEMLALSAGGKLMLKGLRSDFLQGDAQVAHFFKLLGINTNFIEEGVLITSLGVPPSTMKLLEFEISNTPDLFPSLLVSCVALHIEAVFYGITTLFLKESDRVNFLISELSKYYTFINIIDNDKLIIRKSSLSKDSINGIKLSFKTYDDHRLAMALAGLMMRFREVVFDSPTVVNKSYPAFWDEVGRIAVSH